LGFALVIERMFVYNWDMSAVLTTNELEGLDPSLLCDAEIRATFIELRRDNDRREAVAARLLVALHRRGVPAGEGASSTPVWVQYETGQRLRDARLSFATGKACESLLLVAKAWAQGEISANAATTIAQGRRAGHEDVYATMEEPMVAYAAERDFPALDVMIRRYQTRCDELDAKPPEDKNGFFISPVGTRWASKGDHDALSGAIISRAVEAATDLPDPDDPRSAPQRREAALARICRYFLDQGESPTEDGERPHIAITVPLKSLRSGEFETTGDLSLASSQISELLCDSKLQIIVTDGQGHPLDVGATVYRPSRRLRRTVLHRDQGRCRYPGCDRTHGEVHHVIAFAHGETVLANLVFLCDYHHHVLHKPGWHATFDRTTFTVTNPDGRHIGSTRTRVSCP
jgi:hypothetical protein